MISLQPFDANSSASSIIFSIGLLLYAPLICGITQYAQQLLQPSAILSVIE